MTKRGEYSLKQRARRLEETRRRIIQAAMELHGTVGGRESTVSAIARRAGVQRRTVYNHFPDETALVSACIAHHGALDPLPDPAGLAPIPTPGARLRRALSEAYAYYARNAALLANFAAAAHESDAVRRAGEPMVRHWMAVREALAAGWTVPAAQRPRLDAALALVLDYATWSTLTQRGGLDAGEAVELAARMVEGAAAAPSAFGG